MIPPLPLPPDIRSRTLPGVNGLEMHILEAGDSAGPLLLLLHGFPELAYSWRGVMPALAAAGYYVVAPDQRGYGRTTGWDGRYTGDVASFRPLNLVVDLLALLAGLGRTEVAAVIGHDFGSPIAGLAALVRPDVFRSIIMMSAPFSAPPPLPHPPRFDLANALAALDPPRKHYTHHYSTLAANAEMSEPPQGLEAFLRAYVHVKSGDHPGNAPHPLPDASAESFALLPHYYVMDLASGMAETVAPDMPSPDEIEACAWLPDGELAVFVDEYSRTGFQGGLNWYRCAIGPEHQAELRAFSGKSLDVPAAFIAGDRDWGVHQTPGALAAMVQRSTDWRGVHLVPGAGHWVQQENAPAVSRLILDFLRAL